MKNLNETSPADRPEFPVRPSHPAGFSAAAIAAVLAGVLLLAGSGCRSDKPPMVSIIGAEGDPVLDFAGEEIVSAPAGDYTVDRGGEGTLMSYYYSAPPLVRQIKAAYGGMEAVAANPAKTADAPPAPEEKGKKPEPTREQRLAWWREARFGMMVSWGLYAVPAGVWKNKTHPDNYAEWIMFDEKIPVKEYERLAGEFNPVKFDAKAWAALAKKAGMRYVIPLAKHHDGFSMYKSALTDFDIVDATPFKRDFIGELAEACREAGLKFGCYYSVDRDWHRPQGPGNEYKQTNTWDFPASRREDFDRYFREFAKPQVEELLVNYRPDILWFDGIGMKSDSQLEDLVRTIRTLRPDCIINSRIKTFRLPLPEPFLFCDYISLGDNEIADRTPGYEWENPGTLNSTYGYSRNDNNWIDPREIVFRLVDIVSKGGNYLLNVGPTAEGLIPQPSIDRLMEVGTWMETNQEAIYGTSAWRVYGQGPLYEKEAAKAKGKGGPAAAGVPHAGPGRTPLEMRFTAKNKTVYAICLAWPEKDILVKALGQKGMLDGKIAAVSMLGSKEKIRWRQTGEGLSLTVPKNQPCRYALVYKVEIR